MISDENVEIHVNLLKKYIPNCTVKYIVDTDDKTYKFFMLDSDNNECLDIELTSIGSHYVINVASLNKCANSGTANLHGLEQYAKALGNVSEIKMEDTSYIMLCDRYEIPLFCLNILSSGRSWYNKKGYKSSTNSREYQYNKRQIQKKLTAVLPFVLANTQNAFIRRPGKAEIDKALYSIVNQLYDLYDQPEHEGDVFDFIDSQSIKDVFIMLKTYLKKHARICNPDHGYSSYELGVVEDQLYFVTDFGGMFCDYLTKIGNGKEKGKGKGKVKNNEFRILYNSELSKTFKNKRKKEQGTRKSKK